MGKYINENGFVDSRVPTGYFATREDDIRAEMESIENEMRALRQSMVELISGEIESELSWLEPQSFKPHELDTDKIECLALDMVAAAKKLAALHAGWEDRYNDL